MAGPKKLELGNRNIVNSVLLCADPSLLLVCCPASCFRAPPPQVGSLEPSSEFAQLWLDDTTGTRAPLKVVGCSV